MEQERIHLPGSGSLILVVDDQAANRNAFESVLSALGYRVCLAASGPEALALVTRYQFALIVLDVRMPGMDGLETAGCLRRKPFAASTPILFVSAHPGTAEEVRGARVKAPVDYVFSPVDDRALASKVRSILEPSISPRPA